MGDGDFVEAVLSEANEALERKYHLNEIGDVHWIIDLQRNNIVIHR